MLIYLGFLFQAEDGIRDLVRSRGLGDVYKRQHRHPADIHGQHGMELHHEHGGGAQDAQ